MRDPLRLYRNAGFVGFFSFQLLVGGTFLSAVLNPLLLCVSLWCALFGTGAEIDFLSAPFFTAPLLALVVGNALYTYLAMLGPYQRGWLELSPYGLTAPAYWLLISCACYRGLWQLARRPWHWDKTRHGLTRMHWQSASEAAR